MKDILLLSDNHSYVGADVLQHASEVDEIWHAGDIGNIESITPFMGTGTFRAVYGNIDDQNVRMLYPEVNVFQCEGIKVVMTHIGGYPGKYPASIVKLILKEQPDIFICGHSHICKVMPDKMLSHLHMNPGSYGHHGFHLIRTLIRFSIDGDKINKLRVIELGRRGAIAPTELKGL